MICRIWHGWTTMENAAAYERLLLAEIFPGIMGRRINGFTRIELLRRELPDETEFITLMWFENIAAVAAFAGDNYELAVVPEKARAVLSRWDTHSAHFEVTSAQAFAG